MEVAIKILKESLDNQKYSESDKDEIVDAIYFIEDYIYNNSQKGINENNIKQALKLLENGKTIYNGSSHFVAYVKIKGKYYTFDNINDNKKLISYDDVVKHIKNYTIETNLNFS